MGRFGYVGLFFGFGLFVFGVDVFEGFGVEEGFGFFVCGVEVVDFVIIVVVLDFVDFLVFVFEFFL